MHINQLARAFFRSLWLMVFVASCHDTNLTPVPRITISYSQPSGLYDQPIDVTINADVAGTVIEYKLERTDTTGSTTSQSVYTGEVFHLYGSGNYHFTAIGRNRAAKMQDSLETPANFLVDLPGVEPPLPTLQPGLYTGARTVTLFSNTSDADIWYTLDSSDPRVHGQPFTSEIQLLEEMRKSLVYTITAYATKPNMIDSPVVTYHYQIDSFDLCEKGSDWEPLCWLIKGEFSNYRDPFIEHFNEQVRWADPVNEAWCKSGYMLRQDWLGATMDKNWLCLDGPKSNYAYWQDGRGNVTFEGWYITCKIERLGQAHGQVVMQRGIQNGFTNAPATDTTCVNLEHDYQQDPQFGGAMGYWTTHDRITDVRETWGKKRENLN